jgi:hypothetical protein
MGGDRAVKNIFWSKVAFLGIYKTHISFTRGSLKEVNTEHRAMFKIRIALPIDEFGFYS